MTSTPSATNSAASCGSRSALPSAHLTSRRTESGAKLPEPQLPRASAEPTPRYPILAILLARCALAVSGTATIPPIRVINARRCISLCSPDEFVGPAQYRRWDRQAKSFHRLEVDHQLELRGLLDGQISWLGALEILSTKMAAASVHVRKTGSIGHQTADLRRLPEPGQTGSGQSPRRRGGRTSGAQPFLRCRARKRFTSSPAWAAATGWPPTVCPYI